MIGGRRGSDTGAHRSGMESGLMMLAWVARRGSFGRGAGCTVAAGAPLPFFRNRGRLGRLAGYLTT